MRTKSFNRYEVAIRVCWYTCKHNSYPWYNVKGWISLIGFFLLTIPWALYYKITKKNSPDLELF